MNKLRVLGTGIMAAVLSGCLSSASSFVASSVPLEQGRYTEIASEASGTCTQVQWLFFTFGAAGSPQRHALNDALDRAVGADGLVALAVDVEQFAMISTSLMPFPVLPIVTTTRVTGTPVKINVQ